MKLFSGLFGAPEKKVLPKPSVPDAISKMREAINLLEKKEQYLERRVIKEHQEAQDKIRAKDKRSAMVALKRKQQLTHQIESVSNQRLTLESQIINLESVQSQQIAVDALKAGVSAQKFAHQELNLNQLDQLMDDMQDIKDTIDEFDEIFRQNAQVDDADLLGELESMEQEALDNALIETSVPSMPIGGPMSVPHQPIPTSIASGIPSAPARPAASPSAFGSNKKLSDEEQLAMLHASLA